MGLLFVYSLLAFSTVYFGIYAVRAISDQKYKHNFNIYTILSASSATLAFWLLLMNVN